MKLSDLEIQEYILGKRNSPVYEETKKLYESIRVHANGEYPEKLIGERRPHESDYVHKYRKKIYVPITKETFSAVINSLGKIRRSTDWSISYDKSKVPARVPESETLQQYCEFKYPYHTSVTNWTFSVLLKCYLMDANALVLVKPLYIPDSDTEFLQPFPFIFYSDQVIDYKENQYAVLIDGKKDKRGKPYLWHVVDDEGIYTYSKDNKGNIYLESEYFHGLGYMPIVKLKAVYKESVNEYSVYESRLSAMIPRLDEAVREYSDQQANIVNHLFPERWEYASQPCGSCVNEVGVSCGQVKKFTGKDKKEFIYEKCGSCNGTGTVAGSSPYSKFVVRPANVNLGEQTTPIPPFGYVGKDTAIIESVDKRIEFHQYKALASINMQFLVQTPLNQSGLAKEVDRDELNNFVYNVAEDLVEAMDSIYKITNDYRYMIIVQNETERKEMLPSIAVPEKYDILSTTYLADEVKAARESKLNGVIISALEVDYVNKKFYNNSQVKNEMTLVMNLDPMVGATEDEKMLRLQNGGVTRENYIISSNISSFVKRAMQENTDFITLSYDEQMAVMKGYANEIITAENTNLLPTE